MNPPKLTTNEKLVLEINQILYDLQAGSIKRHEAGEAHRKNIIERTKTRNQLLSLFESERRRERVELWKQICEWFAEDGDFDFVEFQIKRLLELQPEEDKEQMSEQLTSPLACRRKRTYLSNATAKRARKRRNKAAGYKYLRHYQCNECGLWHLTTEDKIDPKT